jgi:Cu-Zn family superoxide dismutase
MMTRKVVVMVVEIAMTRINFLVCIFFFLIIFSGCDMSSPDYTPKNPDPIAVLSFNGLLIESDTSFQVDMLPYGTAMFYAEDDAIRLDISLENFPANTTHAIHLHQGSCEVPAMHWNQGEPMENRFCETLSLGIPWAKPYAGDVGNLSVGYDGQGQLSITTNLWAIGTGDYKDLLGRSLIIHENMDDFNMECDPLHGHRHPHANPKVACGIIYPFSGN